MVADEVRRCVNWESLHGDDGELLTEVETILFV